MLLHGSNASLHTWEPWVARLTSEFRVISLDLPGHGLTGKVPSGDYSYSAYIRVLDSLLTHLEVDRFVLVGNSMGGIVAWQYALEQPHRLNGLVLIAAGPPYSWYENEGDRNAVLVFSLLREPWFRSIAEKLDPWYVTVQGVRAAYNNSPVIDEALIMRYYDLNMRAGTRRATTARFAQTSEGEDPDLSQIETPTLIMWGKEDAARLIGDRETV